MVRSVSVDGIWLGAYVGLATTALTLVLTGFLAGCVESGASPPQAQTPPSQAMQAPARRDGVSPRGASVALASLSGVSQPVTDRIKRAFTQEASDREITLADGKAANYLVRGYVNAYSTEAGTAVTIVFDIFNAAKQRAQRIVEDALLVQGAAADPWSVIDTAAISNLAAKSAEDLAAFLTNTPEAIAKSEAAAKVAESEASAPSGSDEGRTIVQKAQPKLPASTAKADDLSIAALR